MTRIRTTLVLLVLLFSVVWVNAQAIPADDASVQLTSSKIGSSDSHLAVNWSQTTSSTGAPVNTSNVSFIRFDFSMFPANLPPQNIQKATLLLYVESGGTSGHVTICQLATAWSSTNLSGTNAPACVPGIAPISFAVTQSQIKEGSFITVDLTPLVQNWFGGQANYGIGLLAEAPITGTGNGINAKFDSMKDNGTGFPAQLQLVLQSQGPKGDKGDSIVGATGPQGPKGDSIVGPIGPQGIQGIPGESITGPIGPQGIQGIPGIAGKDGSSGSNGLNATITIGTVTTLPSGSSAVVSNSGTTQDAVLNFSLPAGPAGKDGAAGSNGRDGIDGAPGPAGASSFAGIWTPTGTYSQGAMVLRPSGFGTRGPFFNLTGNNASDPAGDSTNWVYCCGTATLGYPVFGNSGNFGSTYASGFSGSLMTYTFNAYNSPVTFSAIGISVGSVSSPPTIVTTTTTNTIIAGCYANNPKSGLPVSWYYTAPWNITAWRGYCQSYYGGSFNPNGTFYNNGITYTISTSGFQYGGLMDSWPPPQGIPSGYALAFNETSTQQTQTSVPTTPGTMVWTVLKNGSPTPLTVSTSTVGTFYSPSGQSVTFNPGDTLLLQVTNPSTVSDTISGGAWAIN